LTYPTTYLSEKLRIAGAPNDITFLNG